ncbi:MAG: sigma-70 family RNA polymerase sigma factor [Candidatus Aminicenantes bacterium]|nr:sigma-70 family RNA polymerase sigma factor [Candidatus Aminicenantes bacterium]NIN16499.1 sigma-70 family RNA polymerase sigma factor [Candidatus Aminicenantes bacterium]NIN40359.1 sigma-70 family RNA polymerase sigma factor [Candidatus Aminicenantes bacterium]NIO78979.1 sigma-70 family RNA polymerase sigma factor [Candidatus Aminicenantes bacterium]NIQ64946.1 sigma-70 family RNA polymerase sigma factor [Candidatus Aminicenantes bacterium]
MKMDQKIITLTPGKVGGAKRKEGEETTVYREMINEHFALIERQCFRAVKRQLKGHSKLDTLVNIENEALELSNLVLDTLQRDNYHVLRQFKGNAKLSTYITTIVARQAVDMVRKKLGRSREKERAQKYGKTGMLIYERVIQQGRPVSDVFQELKSREGISESLEEFETITRKIKGKKNNPPSSLEVEANPVVKEGISLKVDGNEKEEVVIPDTHSDPQELLIEEQRKQRLGEVVGEAIAQLSGEERMILRMRFPADEEEKPRKVEQISKLLGISLKATYKRIDRLLKKCRRLLEHKGVNIDELL